MRSPNTTIVLALLAIAGCPGPKDETPGQTDVADEGKAETEGRPAAEPNPSGDGDGDGDPAGATDTGAALTCEDDLAKTKAALADCMAAQG